ncbi:MAG TPA: galactokinase [Flavisolibacter sp.]|nr:galactokinase [Flavisolibacter sp.]
MVETLNNRIAQHVADSFSKRFNEVPIVVRSPGRVNIIGEHTDYNNGFVLPASIDKAIYVAISPRKDSRVELYSDDFKEDFQVDYNNLKPSSKVWPNYILGVADQLLKKGYKISGFNLAIGGDVPIGAGLSSSAAVECATAFALNTVFELGISKMDIVLIAQKAEQDFAGVMVGIMDQFASVFGKKDHVIKLDCQSRQYEYVPLKMPGLKIVLLNTNVEHSLASSEYNNRRKQCEEGVALVKEHVNGVSSLRDVTVEMLDKYVKNSNTVVYKRCSYVVKENIRLLQGCEDLKRGDVAALGKKMFETHEGLSKDYEVSCAELDFLVDAVKNNPDVLGARMMGGGFGGCTINLVKEYAIENLVKKVGESYKNEMKKELTSYVAKIEDGTSVIS